MGGIFRAKGSGEIPRMSSNTINIGENHCVDALLVPSRIKFTELLGIIWYSYMRSMVLPQAITVNGRL